MVIVQKFLLPLALLLSPLTVYAHSPQEGMIWASAGPLTNRTVETPQPSGVEHSFLGTGLLIEGDLSNHGGLEIGILYLERQYYMKYKGAMLVERVNRVHIPLGYRYWFTDKFSASLAFYSSYRTGDVVQVIRPTSVPKTVQTTAGDEIAEYGIDFAGQWEAWTNGKYAAVIDGRYSLLINENAHESADHYTILVGLKYLVQSKNTKN